MKKLCSLLLALVICFGSSAFPVAAEKTVIIEIATAQQLSDIRNNLSGHYRLAQDIVFTEADFEEGGAFYNGGEGWQPIGTSYTATTAFTGVLDGNGHTISGLKIVHNGTGSNAKFAGLFGHMNGTVRNLALDEVDITVTNTRSTRVGAVAGQSQGAVENVSADGTIRCLDGTNTTAVGGLVGRQTKTAVISGCLSDVDVIVTGNTVRLGGIVGESEGGMVLACQTTGKVDGYATYTLYVGGIVGHNHAASSGSNVTAATVTNCLRDGEIVGFAKSSLVGGGIIGWNESGVVDSCVTLQTVDFTGDTGLTAGQVIGDNKGGTTTALYYVENDAEFPANGAGNTVQAVKLPTVFTASDIGGLLTDDGFWSYQNGTLILNDLPLIPALRYNGVEYTVNSNKTATIVGFSKSDLVTIPVTIGTYRVVAVGETVFVDQPTCYAGTKNEWASVTVGDGNTALTDLVCLGDVKFAGASLTIHNALTVNYKVDVATLESQQLTDPYVEFEFNGETVTVTDYTVADGRYVFDFDNVAPHQMLDTITATVYAQKNGVVYEGETHEYSVAAYCYTMLGEYSSDEYADLRRLLVDLLVYGGKAQVYADYDADTPVDSSLSDEQRAWGTTEDLKLESVTDVRYRLVNDPIAKWKRASLYLQDKVALRFEFETDQVDNLWVKVQTANGQWKISPSEFVQTEDGYTVLFDKLSAAQMSETVYVTVYRGSLPVSHTLRYSVESYACSKAAGDDIALAELVQAMMNYGNAAKAYAENG